MLDRRVSEIRLVEVEAAAAQQTLVVHLATGVLVAPKKKQNRRFFVNLGGSRIVSTCSVSRVSSRFVNVHTQKSRSRCIEI
jgi:hypothetical protein